MATREQIDAVISLHKDGNRTDITVEYEDDAPYNISSKDPYELKHANISKNNLPVIISSVLLTTSGSTSLTTGATDQTTLLLTFSDNSTSADFSKVVMSSTDITIVTVDSNGLVIADAVNIGTADIRATSVENGTLISSLTYTVA